MSDKVLGIDVSHHQENIDWAVVAKSVHFVFIKATEGVTYTDPHFRDNWKQAGENGLLRGAYHFYRPDSPADKQAEHFAATVGKESELPLVLDLENPVGLPDSAQLLKDVKLFLDTVEQSTGRKPIIYTMPNFWNMHMKGAVWANQYDLWIAHYTTRAEPSVPAPWDHWLFWQYTQTGNGKSVGIEEGNVDMNWFNGSIDDLYQYARVEEKPDEETDIVPPMKVEVTASPSLNVRLGAGDDQPRVGRVVTGQTLQAVELKKDDDGHEWIAVKMWVAAKYKGKQFVKPAE